jgi:replicative DNA helicase
MKELEEQLNAHLKHSKSLNEISLNLSTKPLKCGFSSFEDNDYLVEGEGNLLIISAKPGHGKCWAKGTPILKYDGTVVPVETIQVGDKLMGPDSTPRTVVGLGSGTEEMFTVTPTKGDTFTCNRSHILSLVMSSTVGKYKQGQVVNMTVHDYLTQTKTFKEKAKLYRTGVAFAKQPKAEFDPYWVGLWLGDGSVGKTNITKNEPELWNYYSEFATAHGLRAVRHDHASRCSDSSFIAGNRKNPLLTYVRGLVVDNQKHIPQTLLTASREERLRLLAGLLDTDGTLDKNTFEIVTKYPKLRDGILFLARSLGFAAYSKTTKKGIKSTGFVGTYYRINISGNTDFIPTKLPRKQATPRRQIKDVLRVGFTVESKGKGRYYGFTLDQDRLFLLGDFTVAHNTALSTNIGLNVASYGRVLYFSLEMSARALKKRIVGIESGVPIKKLAEPVFAKKVADAIDRLSKLKFDIVDDKDLTLNSIISKTHDENNRGKLSLVIVDYIGIIDYAGKTRHEAIADAAKRFKDEVADKLKIPVIVLAQMKNGFDERYAKAKMEYEKAKQYPTGANKDIMNIRPSLEDIGESSGIGKAADVVMFLHRPCLLDPTEPTSLFKVYVAKAREGEPKDFQLEFSSSLTKFIDRNNSI